MLNRRFILAGCSRAGIAVVAVALGVLAGCGADPADESRGPDPSKDYETLFPSTPSAAPTTSPTTVPGTSTSRPAEPPTTTAAAPEPGSDAEHPAPGGSGGPPPQNQNPDPDPAPPAQNDGNYTTAGRSALVTELNERRADLGLAPLAYSAKQAGKAEACAKKNLDEKTFKHCGYEVLWAQGSAAMPTPEQLLNAWFKSEAHRKALTGKGSTIAGGAIVRLGNRVIAALALNY